MLVIVRVLVVEDSSAVRSRVVTLLREEGLDVVGEAANAVTALALTSALRPDGIVLDLQLPDRNGMDILPALKAGADAPVVVVLTNASQHGYRSRCLALGADDFLDKSTDFDRVAAALSARLTARSK